jgi:hypothetical protein
MNNCPDCANAAMRAEAAELLLAEERAECEALRQKVAELRAELDSKPQKAPPEPKKSDSSWFDDLSYFEEYLRGTQWSDVQKMAEEARKQSGYDYQKHNKGGFNKLTKKSDNERTTRTDGMTSISLELVRDQAYGRHTLRMSAEELDLHVVERLPVDFEQYNLERRKDIAVKIARSMLRQLGAGDPPRDIVEQMAAHIVDITRRK